MNQSKTLNRTERGFPAPASLPERLVHEQELVLPVRVSAWERKFLHSPADKRVIGRVVLVPHGDDNTFDLVVLDAE